MTAGGALGLASAPAALLPSACARRGPRARAGCAPSVANHHFSSAPSRPAQSSPRPRSLAAASSQSEPSRAVRRVAARAASGEGSSSSEALAPAAEAAPPATAEASAATEAAEADIPKLKTSRLLSRSLALGWKSFRALLIVSAAASFAEQIVSFFTFAVILVTGLPSGSWVTLTIGISGIVAGFFISVWSKAAGYVVLHDIDTRSDTQAYPPDPAGWTGFRAAWSRRAAAARAAVPASLLPRVVWADLTRLLSIAWQGFLTFPVPLLSVPRALDLALATPALVLEGLDAKAALGRSEALVRSRRGAVLRVGLLLFAAVAAAAVGAVGAIVYCVPELPGTMLGLPLAPGTAPSDLLADFVSGAAFNRVFEAGSTVEQGALTLALVLGVALRWLALHGILTATYAAWRVRSECRALGAVPVRPHPALKLLGAAWGKGRAATERWWGPAWAAWEVGGKPTADRLLARAAPVLKPLAWLGRKAMGIGAGKTAATTPPPPPEATGAAAGEAAPAVGTSLAAAGEGAAGTGGGKEGQQGRAAPA